MQRSTVVMLGILALGACGDDGAPTGTVIFELTYSFTGTR
jgi:hypothetical protein